MGPPEKLSPEICKNPRSKSFEVPTTKQVEMLNERKIARGASYSPKASVSSKVQQESSKWSRVSSRQYSQDGYMAFGKFSTKIKTNLLDFPYQGK